MADSYIEYTVAAGGQSTFTVPFPYLSVSDVQVSVNGIPQLIPTSYQWVTGGSITFSPALPEGAVVLITRQTSPDSMEVTFNNGAVLSASDLNTAALQCFYRTQEIQDSLNEWINGGITLFGNGVVTGDMSAQDLIDSVSAYILSTNLANTLQQNISDITTNSELIAGQGEYINTLQTYQAIGILETLSLLGTVTDDGSSFILNVDTTQISGLSALSSSVTTLQTTVGDNTAAIETAATSIDGLQAQYTVKVDVNGHVTGFGLSDVANDGTITSTFIVNADAFAIIDTSNGLSSAVVPFAVRSGVTYIQDVVIEGALIATGSITNAEIANGTITTAKIGNGQITNALIANAAIGTAQIGSATITGNLIVDGTIKSGNIATSTITSGNIQQGQISGVVMAGNPAPNPITGTGTLIGSLTVPAGYTTVIYGRVELSFTGESPSVTVQLYDATTGVILDQADFTGPYGDPTSVGTFPSMTLIAFISDSSTTDHDITLRYKNNSTVSTINDPYWALSALIMPN
jgi:hypothetical protein